ncbi:MAG: transposase [Eggerthellaceae bacterium]|nr:transposase [Eggerthellaceae bacterium]
MVRRQARLARQLDKPRPKKRRLRDEAAAKTLKRNREGVLNGYKLNKTNATAGGGLNSPIKAMKRMSHGSRPSNA